MKINHRHGILMILALMSIVVTSLSYFYIHKKVILSAEKNISVKKEIQSEDDRKQKEENSLKVYDLAKDKIGGINSFLVEESNIVSFIEMVEHIASSTGARIELSSINFETDKIKTKVNISGSWSDVMNSLLTIENLPLSLNINNLSLNKQGGLEKGSGWSLSLDIEALKK